MTTKEKSTKKKESQNDNVNTSVSSSGMKTSQDFLSPQVFDKLPSEVQDFMNIAFQMQSFSGPPSAFLAQKMTPAHITSIIDNAEKDDQRLFKMSLITKIINLGIFLVIIAFLIFLIIFLSKENPNVFLEILKVIISFAGGIGVGIGYKSIKK